VGIGKPVEGRLRHSEGIGPPATPHPESPRVCEATWTARNIVSRSDYVSPGT
jgi:hypothetical protein